MSDVFYSDSNPEAPKFTEFEWRLKKTFTFDDYKDFSDLKIYEKQNDHRFSTQFTEFGLPWTSFCFTKNSRRNSFIQRHLCENYCFWDPKVCFFENSHSGNLFDLMDKKFHRRFNPLFEEQFNRNYSGKIDWSLTGGIGNYPNKGLYKLIEELGITTKLQYSSDGCAVNFDNLKRELRDDDPIRPFYVFEEKKCHDVVEALFNINRKNIQDNKIEMASIYNESYKGNGPVREPILSLMMWGPLADFYLKKSYRKCDLNSVDPESRTHTCTNFSEKNYWMYSHSSRVACETGLIDALEGPVMTKDFKIVYPCNQYKCNHVCLCSLCENSHMCPKSDHKGHIEDKASECKIVIESECQEHKLKHPKNFDLEEDISVSKNIFYHNLDITDNPRNHSIETIRLAGIKERCDKCRANVKEHFKHHKVFHLHCRLCSFQAKTFVDKSFWDRVCNVCDKTFETARKLKYWHISSHTSNWICEKCESTFTRKWTLRRHLEEIHKMIIHDIDYESDDDYDDEKDSSLSIETESDYESSSEDSEAKDYESKGPGSSSTQFKCNVCEKQFSVQRYLSEHVRINHSEKPLLFCDDCKQSFTLKHNLKRHMEIAHSQRKANTCQFCGKTFTRKDHLREHIKVVHSGENEIFTCPYCEKVFSKKWNMKRHAKKCMSSNRKF